MTEQKTASVEVPVELDTSLWAEQVTIVMEDNYQWTGYWLLGHMIVWSATHLSHIDDPAVRIKTILAGTKAFALLNGTSAQVLPEPVEV